MSCSYYAFRTLPFEQQLQVVWKEGTFVAQRWEKEDAVGLYYMEGGFFCEVYVKQDTVARLHIFTSSERLMKYFYNVRLDDLPL